MKTLFLFRTNLTNRESYHSINNIEEFKKECWDFYLLQSLWFLENNYFDEVIVWRLTNSNHPDIIFDINGKKFIQRWVNNFNEVFKYERPSISFFRGGFPEYDEITKKNPKFFGLKLYLAAGKRLLPQYNGIYDKILIEDEKDNIDKRCIPFYKTTNSNMFKPLNDVNNEYDLCIISNFTQLKYKGTDFIINEIPKSKYLKKLKICHIGNKSEIGIKLTKKNNVNNITFLGSLERKEINEVLNKSKFGIVASNSQDGCPRVITEILTSGTPLFIRDETRLLNYYKKNGVLEFNTNNFLKVIQTGFDNYDRLKRSLRNNLDNFNIKKICKMNFNLW